MVREYFLALACGVCALVASATVRADDGDTSTIGAPDCRIVNPSPRPHESTAWSGGCRDGYADGDGVLQWSMNGDPVSRYEGHMSVGRPEGHGTYEHTEKTHTRYEGNFHNGKRQGQGTFTQSNGTRVTGSWDKGELAGQVEAENPNGYHYVGGWRDMAPEGQGEVTYDDGAHYVGSFVQGVREGQGTLSHDGITTTSTWHNNDSQGVTDIVGPGGYHFHGPQVDGEAQGAGELRDKNGNLVGDNYLGRSTTTILAG